MSTSNNDLQGEYRSSFSGADITAVIAGTIIGTLQAISYSVTREKGPIYTIGSPNPRSFARGKRAVAGTLVFVTIDKSSLISHFHQSSAIKKTASNNVKVGQFYGKVNDDKLTLGADGALASTITHGDANLFNETGTAFSTAGEEAAIMDATYVDQLLPFDINISAANEYGQVMKRSFVGCEILNEGGGVSIDDIVVEEQYSYIARIMTPWVRVGAAV